MASAVCAESSTKSSATSSTAGTTRTGALGRTLHNAPRRVGPSKGKRPLEIDVTPRLMCTSGYPERLGQSKPVTERPHGERHSEGSRGHHRTSSKEIHSERDNTIVMLDQFMGQPIVYQPVEEKAGLRRARQKGSRGDALKP